MMVLFPLISTCCTEELNFLQEWKQTAFLERYLCVQLRMIRNSMSKRIVIKAHSSDIIMSIFLLCDIDSTR